MTKPTGKPQPEDAPEVTMDLDTLERENPALPFRFRHAGRDYLLSDPQEIDWQDLMAAIGNPVLFLHMVLPSDDQTAFFSSKVSTWKMNALMKRYTEHYGLPSAGEAKQAA